MQIILGILIGAFLTFGSVLYYRTDTIMFLVGDAPVVMNSQINGRVLMKEAARNAILAFNTIEGADPDKIAIEMPRPR